MSRHTRPDVTILLLGRLPLLSRAVAALCFASCLLLAALLPVDVEVWCPADAEGCCTGFSGPFIDGGCTFVPRAEIRGLDVDEENGRPRLVLLTKTGKETVVRGWRDRQPLLEMKATLQPALDGAPPTTARATYAPFVWLRLAWLTISMLLCIGAAFLPFLVFGRPALRVFPAPHRFEVGGGRLWLRRPSMTLDCNEAAHVEISSIAVSVVLRDGRLVPLVDRTLTGGARVIAERAAKALNVALRER